MSDVVVGLFDRREDASRAVDAALDRGYRHDVVDVSMYEGELPIEEIDDPGTRSVSLAVRGGAASAVIGAAIGAIILGFALGEPLLGAIVGLLAGLLYGVVAGLISGRDTPKAAMTRAARAVDRGKVLVSVEVDSTRATREVIELLLAHGGRVQTA